MNNQQALVSIIIPAYNYASFLAEAVTSALRQSYTSLDIIIVDDGSTDNTGAVAQQLSAQDKRVRYVHQANQGLSAARNTGMRAARGDFLVFLDADDVLHEQKIAAHLEHFQQYPDTDISYGRSRYFLSTDPQQTFATLALGEEDWMPCISGRAATIMPALIINNIMPVCSAMLRRSVHERVGEFDTTLKSLEDWDYWLRAAAADCLFCYSDDTRFATFIRVHDISMSQNSLRMLQTQYRLRREHIPRSIETMNDRQLAAHLQRDNNKRRLRCLTTLAGEMGASSPAFRALCRGESPTFLLRLLNRLLSRLLRAQFFGRGK